MPTPFWRSPETLEQINRLDRSGFAVEFLRRNPAYRRDYGRLQRRIARREANTAAERAAFAERWGAGFVHAPDEPARRGHTAWRPAVSPATLIVASAPSGFMTLMPMDAAIARPLPGGPGPGSEADAWLIVCDGAGDLFLRLADPSASVRPAVTLPMDAAAELRFDVAQRFLRRLRGKSVALLPRALQLTPLQRARQVQLLLAFDIRQAGGSARDVATAVGRSWQAIFPAVEWKNTAARRHAERLLHDAEERVNGGYLDFLRGK